MPVDTSIVEPDSLEITSVLSQDITSTEDGFIEVIVSGGTEPYLFTLTPGDTIKDSGTFSFIEGQGRYIFH